MKAPLSNKSINERQILGMGTHLEELNAGWRKVRGKKTKSNTCEVRLTKGPRVILARNEM